MPVLRLRRADHRTANLAMLKNVSHVIQGSHTPLCAGTDGPLEHANGSGSPQAAEAEDSLCAILEALDKIDSVPRMHAGVQACIAPKACAEPSRVLAEAERLCAHVSAWHSCVFEKSGSHGMFCAGHAYQRLLAKANKSTSHRMQEMIACLEASTRKAVSGHVRFRQIDCCMYIMPLHHMASARVYTKLHPRCFICSC